jgi:hypothetical protein
LRSSTYRPPCNANAFIYLLTYSLIILRLRVFICDVNRFFYYIFPFFPWSCSPPFPLVCPLFYYLPVFYPIICLFFSLLLFFKKNLPSILFSALLSAIFYSKFFSVVCPAVYRPFYSTYFSFCVFVLLSTPSFAPGFTLFTALFSICYGL